MKARAIGAGPTTEDNGLAIDTAVGYPVCLWPEGNTGDIAASDSDGDLEVAISASIASVKIEKPKYSMGDGATTTWNADWAAADQTGTIELARTTTRSHVVGEIQALIRKR